MGGSAGEGGRGRVPGTYPSRLPRGGSAAPAAGPTRPAPPLLVAITHRLSTSTFLPLPRGEVFAFFADAENLARITPLELAFEIVTPRPIDLREGALIDYRLGLFGVRFGWRTEITAWQPPYRFVDEQVRGPYRLWHHTHTFVEAAGPDGTPGTRMDDLVRYQLPLSPLGDVGFPLVRLQLERIFRYRERAIRRFLLPDGRV